MNSRATEALRGQQAVESLRGFLVLSWQKGGEPIMHMADALLSPAVGASFWAGTLTAISLCAHRLRNEIDGKLIPLMGVLGAFVFAAQMINFTIPGTGSSGHLGGGMLLAIILGPAAAFLTIASVLIIQALFFADGGLLALGCNIWNLGIYPCFIAYPLIFKLLTSGSPGHGRFTAAVVISAVFGLQLGAFSVVLQTVLSGRGDLPLTTFALMMQPIHLAIGLVEGVVTAGLVSYIRSVRPEILEGASSSRQLDSSTDTKKVLLAFGMLTVVTAGALSWFASNNPDGLEWAIRKVSVGTGVPVHEDTVKSGLSTVQEKTAFLPDYGFRKSGKSDDVRSGVPASADTETSVSGIVGSALVLGAVLFIGIGIRALRSRRAKNRQ